MSIPPPIPKGSPPPIPQTTKQKEKFTPAGLVFILATIVATIGGGIVCVFWLFPRVLPGGRYPILLLAVPIVGCGIAAAAIGTWLFKLFGVAITIPIEEKPEENLDH